jgi:hypothetical protein
MKYHEVLSFVCKQTGFSLIAAARRVKAIKMGKPLCLGPHAGSGVLYYRNDNRFEVNED